MLDCWANGNRGVPRYSRFKEFWGWDVCVVREQGARVAHNLPHEQGGPSEWLVMPPDGVLFGSDLRRDLWLHYQGVSTNVSLPGSQGG